MNVTVGRFFVGKVPSAALHQAIKSLEEVPFEVLVVRVQVQGDVPPLK